MENHTLVHQEVRSSDSTGPFHVLWNLDLPGQESSEGLRPVVGIQTISAVNRRS